jgi:hypothetical protein
MATYYVRTDGNDANAGTGSGTGQAWKTINYALGSTSGFASGDTLWIAPGTYREQITVAMTNPTAATYINGDPSASQFSGVNAGIVRITNALTDDLTAVTSGALIDTALRNYLKFSKIYFNYCQQGGIPAINIGSTSGISKNLDFIDCVFQTTAGYAISHTTTPIPFGSGSVYLTVRRCIFSTSGIFIRWGRGTGADDQLNIVIESSMAGSAILATNASGTGSNSAIGPITVTNCSCHSCSSTAGVSLVSPVTTWSQKATVKNCVIVGTTNALLASNTTIIVENYNLLQATSPRNNVTAGANSIVGNARLERFQLWNANIENRLTYSLMTGSPAIGAGDGTVSPAGGDVYGNAWASPPSMGAIEGGTITAAAGGIIVHPGMTGGIRG